MAAPLAPAGPTRTKVIEWPKFLAVSPDEAQQSSDEALEVPVESHLGLARTVSPDNVNAAKVTMATEGGRCQGGTDERWGARTKSSGVICAPKQLIIITQPRLPWEPPAKPRTHLSPGATATASQVPRRRAGNRDFSNLKQTKTF
ncbi:hypothetical protein SKAU_G00407130 [Synaphobranchus kaupii]|uniref:Uncharacterized protein n=1 Tax=Synaphobranchus kaupii TaxID=118154 RepID=A0A9Q1EA73_SYNKA|nr:hypothetical protein SKAU_G00407130 [Synaphobranchus kaupii]